MDSYRRRMTLHFYKRDKGLLPKLLRYFGGGDFNHVSIEVDGWIYEAIGGRFSGNNGVMVSPSKRSQHRGIYSPNLLVSVVLDLGDESELIDFLNLKVGQKYDYLDLFTFVFRWMKGNENKYYCSELAKKSIEIVTGKKLKLNYSPSAIYDIAQSLKK